MSARNILKQGREHAIQTGQHWVHVKGMLYVTIWCTGCRRTEYFIATPSHPRLTKISLSKARKMLSWGLQHPD